MVGAGLSGLLGWMFGLTAVFWLAALFGLLSIVSVLMIPSNVIDHAAARGLKHNKGEGDRIGGYRVLIECKPLLILAASLLLFHLGNAAMLPLYGMAVVSSKHANPAGFVAITIVVAQAVMILAALVAMQLGERKGLWLVLLISFAALPIRGILAAIFISQWGVYPVQILDGIGAGMQSVAVPGLVARILYGTGRINVGQGAVMTAQGIGAAVSPAIGGWIAQEMGYSIAVGSVVLWLCFGPILQKAGAVEADRDESPLAPDPRPA